MAASKKSASRKAAAKKAGKARKPRKAAKKASPPRKRQAAKKKVAAKRRSRPAVKKASAPRRRPAAAALPTPAPRTTEIDQRIAIVRNNLRDLVEQAAVSAGAAGEELMSQRIAEQESKLAALIKQREELSAGGS